MRRLAVILMTSLALTAHADAGLRDRVQARRDARKPKACQVAPASRPAYLPETLPVLTGPVVTAVRQCAGGVCPR